jgi:dGTPase
MHMQIRTTKRILAMMTDNLVAATAGAIRAAGVDSPQAVRDAADPCATFAEPTAGQVRQLQDFLCERVYRHPKNLQADREGQQMIRELFEVFLEHPDVLPERYERRIAEQGAHRVVCDYVAGMTDRFCRETHARLCG